MNFSFVSDPNMSKVDEILSLFDKLSPNDQYKVARYVKYNKPKADRQIIGIETNYTARLTRGDSPWQLEEALINHGAKLILIVDTLWGDGCYWNVHEYGYDSCLYPDGADRQEVAKQLPEELRQLFIEEGSSGRAFFELVGEPDFTPYVQFVRDLDYCAVFNNEGKISTTYIDDTHVRVWKFDTESG